MHTTFQYNNQRVTVEPRFLQGRERLGESCRFVLELFAAEPVELEELVGRACVVARVSGSDERAVHGVKNEVVMVLNPQDAAAAGCEVWGPEAVPCGTDVFDPP